MRVLHLGNIANNGYINAKLLRRAGLEADVLADEQHILSRPEWEDAPLGGTYLDYDSLDEEARRTGWTAPPWLRFPGDPASLSPERFKGELRLRLAVTALRRARCQHGRLAQLYDPLHSLLGPLKRRDVATGVFHASYFELAAGSFQSLEQSFDVFQAYATHPIHSMLLCRQRPYVAFEHGTMRELPFEDSWRGRLLALAYRQAAKVVITNPDVVAQARLLGLENYTFIPHPLDEEKYRPGLSKLRGQLEGEGVDFVVLCPSRHDWHVKGNDRLLRGFAEFVRSDRPRAQLIVFEWGADVQRSRELVEVLGITANVRWHLPLPKLRLIDAYRAADVICDQFLIGTFGAVAPEAMACARPVVMAFDPDIHRWCFPTLPPVVDARTSEQIRKALQRLAADRGERERLCAEGRDWVERHHSWRLVVGRQVAIYEEVVEASKKARGTGYAQVR